jgi:sugar lactone lactonase YvrE
VFKGRILRLRIRDDKVVKTTVVAIGMEHPNGIRVHRNHVYRFGLEEEGVRITNTLEDRHILATFLTCNKITQYGVDGIEFDKQGNLYVGNFGDGAVYRIRFCDDGSVKENKVWAQDPSQLKSTDGMIIGAEGNLYIADFCDNAVAKVQPKGKVTRIAQSPDSDGLHGELDQPGEPIIWKGKLVLACFDLVTGPDKVNTKHEMPATLSELEPR